MPDFISNSRDLDKIAQQVSSALEAHESASHNILSDRDLYLDMYKGVNVVAYRDSRPSSGLSALPSPTTSESVETLTNMIFAMLTAADPNFQLTSLSGRQDQSSLFKNTQLLRMQHDRTKRKKKLLKTVRSMVLNGSAFAEQPFIAFPSGTPDPAWEATDFIHRPFTQMFWMPKAIDIDYSDYMGSIDAISANRLRSLSDMDKNGDSWLSFEIELALKKTEADNFTGSDIRQSLTNLGYTDLKGVKEFISYWGPLQDLDGGKADWVVGLLNRKYVVRLHPSPYPRGMRPYRFAQHIALEDDPLGIGVGQQLRKQQPYINSNLNRTMDNLILATFQGTLVNRIAGLKSSDIKFKPWFQVEVDDINGIKPYPIDTNGAQFGLKLHELLVEQARNQTGATPTLQAIITDASASEVKIAQSNSMRAVSNKADTTADEFIREAVQFDNFNNYLWLDRPIWINAVGMEKPEIISPDEIAKNVGVIPRVVTDKDYTPQKLKNALQLLQIVTSIRNQIPPDSPIWGLVADITSGLGYDPSRFIPKAQPAPDPRVMLGLLAKEAAMRQQAASPAESFIGAQQGVNEIANA